MAEVIPNVAVFDAEAMIVSHVHLDDTTLH
jgi:hypothetical protein